MTRSISVWRKSGKMILGEIPIPTIDGQMQIDGTKINLIAKASLRRCLCLCRNGSIREVREILQNGRQPNPHTLRFPTSRTRRCSCHRSSRRTLSKNRIKSNNRKVFTPSGYIPPTNSPLRTSRQTTVHFFI